MTRRLALPLTSLCPFPPSLLFQCFLVLILCRHWRCRCSLTSLDIDQHTAMAVTPSATFTGPLTRLRSRDNELQTPILSSNDASKVTPAAGPSYRLITTLVPIYTSVPPTSVPPQAADDAIGTALPQIGAPMATTSLEPKKTIAPLASHYFPQATNPLWIPSQDDVPMAWRPHFEQNQTYTETGFMMVIVGIFFLGIVGVVGGSIIG
jgi:hypothetical protein